MFGMGWTEIMVVLAIAIMVIGPEQLPGVARTIGRMLAQFKRAANDLKSAVGDEISQHEEFNDFKDFSSDIQSEVRNITGTAQDYMQSEIDKGEQELDKLEQELATPGEDATEETAAEETTEDNGDGEADNAVEPAIESGDAEPIAEANTGVEANTGAEANTPDADGDDVDPPRKETA